MRLAGTIWLALLCAGCHLEHERSEPDPEPQPSGAQAELDDEAAREDAEPLSALEQDGTPRLDLGPQLGAITDRSVKIWIRADRPASWKVHVWPAGSESALLEVAGPQLTAASDFCGSVQVDALGPGRAYEYAVFMPNDEGSGEVARGSFRTLPLENRPARTRFVLGADITGSGPQRIFRQIQGLQPDFALFLGDQIYADEAEPTRDGYASFYRRNWSIKYLRPMLQHVPTHMIWDDHEIQDNYWQGKSERYAPAREAYELYVQSHNPEPYRRGALYYTTRVGDIAIFVLDVRSYRSQNSMPDGPQKTMLGSDQKSDLLDWLRREPARLKIIASPVVWSDWAKNGQDPWRSFATEREEILGVIARERIGDVLLLSGDQHWSAVFRFRREQYTFYEFLPTPFSKTRGVVPSDETDEILARDDDHFVFGVVDVDTTREPITIDLTLCASEKPCRPGEEPAPGASLDQEDEAENVPFTIHLTGRELGREE